MIVDVEESGAIGGGVQSSIGNNEGSLVFQDYLDK